MDEPVFVNQEDALFGVMAAVATVMEVMVDKEIVAPEVLAEMLELQRDMFLKKRQPDSADVLNLMIRPLTDPRRKGVRSLLKKPPEGSA